MVIQDAGNAEVNRRYLGMSGIGQTCRRRLWMDFRWCSPSSFDAATLKRFEDGHTGEAIMATRLKMVAGINLRTVDRRTGRQFACVDHGGHFRGHLDGKIVGLFQADVTDHVWEHKQVDGKKFQALERLKKGKGEKKALAAWDGVYHAQACVYMHYTDMTRHYLTCSTPGGRETTSVRTKANPAVAARLVDKALEIIQADHPPEKISQDPAWWQCKMCHHHPICHGQAVSEVTSREIPEVTCRSCCHATAEMSGDGDWSCALWPHGPIPLDAQRAGCPRHVFIPALLPWKSTDANPGENWVAYRTEDGRTFRNGDGCYKSTEVRANPFVLGVEIVESIYGFNHASSVTRQMGSS